MSATADLEETPLAALWRLIARRAPLVLMLIAAISAAAFYQLVDFSSHSLRVSIDPSLDPLVAHDDPAREYYETVRRRFGNDESVLLLLQVEDAYSGDTLRRLTRLTNVLRSIDGVADVTSLANTALPRRDGDELSFERLREQDYDDPALPARLREGVENNALLRGQLISADGRAAAIVVLLEPQSDREMLDRRLADLIIAAADSEAGPQVKVAVTGAAIVRAATSETVMRQLRWVIPAIVVLLMMFLALTFRSLRGVLVPLATITLALIWTFATLSLIGRPLNLITSLVPPLLVTMGLAYCAHILCEFESLPPARTADERRARIALLLQDVAAPVMLTGFTTGIGLLALLLNDLPAIREFAWLSALGVFYTVVLALTFIPAALRYTSPRGPDNTPGHRWIERNSRRLGEFDIRNRRTILWVAALVFLAAAAASSRIRIGDQFVGIFAEDSRVRADYETVNRTLGGVNPLAIVVDGAPDTFTNPEVLRKLEKLQRWLAQQPEVGAVSGLVDHVKLLNQTLGDADEPTIPATRELVKQLLLFGDSQLLSAVVDSRRSSTQIAMRLRVDDTADIGALIERIEARVDELQTGLDVHVTGNAALLTQSVRTATTGQLQSVALALLLIYLCLAAQFASFKVGFYLALPTALQTALYFGALGLSGITLNATTSLVECLVLGLAVDDTIHYLARFNKAARRSASESKAAVAALSGVLRPITLTKAMLALGFLMLATGELRNQMLFGGLAAFTLLSAWLVDVLVTPAFVSGLRIVTIWDSLRLNLGRDIQKTIPLFAGLTNRQARLFALMSRMEEVPAGTRLMTEGESAGNGVKGDPAGDVLVVIDGKLSVFNERDGQRIDVNILRRGAVVGEAGYFGQKRTASVDAITKARLLRFDDADQDRICRQYPKVAARVFLNLNRIQAERRAVEPQLQRASQIDSRSDEIAR